MFHARSTTSCTGASPATRPSASRPPPRCATRSTSCPARSRRSPRVKPAAAKAPIPRPRLAAAARAPRPGAATPAPAPRPTPGARRPGAGAGGRRRGCGCCSSSWSRPAPGWPPTSSCATRPTGAGAAAARRHRPLPPASEAEAVVTDFDPFGDDRQQEDRDRVGNVDRRRRRPPRGPPRSTTTSREKPGVGCILALDGEYGLSRSSVTTEDSGWSAADLRLDRTSAPRPASTNGATRSTSGTDVATSAHLRRRPDGARTRGARCGSPRLPARRPANGSSSHVTEVELA